MGLATALSVIGASIGFKLSWGLIGAFVGFVLGFAIRLFMELVVKKNKRDLKGKHSEVILIVDCEGSQYDLIEDILWSHFELGVAKIK